MGTLGGPLGVIDKEEVVDTTSTLRSDGGHPFSDLGLRYQSYFPRPS